MLDKLEARAMAAGRIAAARARMRVAQALGQSLPGVTVSIEGGEIVLSGRLDWDDARLRWIAREVL